MPTLSVFANGHFVLYTDSRLRTVIAVQCSTSLSAGKSWLFGFFIKLSMILITFYTNFCQVNLTAVPDWFFQKLRQHGEGMDLWYPVHYYTMVFLVINCEARYFFYDLYDFGLRSIRTTVFWQSPRFPLEIFCYLFLNKRLLLLLFFTLKTFLGSSEHRHSIFGLFE